MIKHLQKKNLDYYLRELAKNFAREMAQNAAEIVLIGGAAVLANYGFREMTYDIDAIYNRFIGHERGNQCSW